MRSNVFFSSPLVALTRIISGSSHGRIAVYRLRACREGITPSTIWASATAVPKSQVTATLSGNRNPGRNTSFLRVAAILAARSDSKTHSRTLSNRGASTIASAVPQLPPPIIASVFMDVEERPSVLPDRAMARRASRTAVGIFPPEEVLGPQVEALQVGFVPVHDEPGGDQRGQKHHQRRVIDQPHSKGKRACRQNRSGGDVVGIRHRD